MIKNLFLVIIIWPLTTVSQTQQDTENLEKFWKYRNLFRQEFIKIGPGQGESIVMNTKRPDRYCLTTSGGHNTSLHYGDQTLKLGYYIGMLAMEYRLLKDEAEDLTPTLNELFYALNAYERLDINAEDYLSQGQALNSYNGLFIRDDVPFDFYENFEFDDPYEPARCVNSNYNVIKKDPVDNATFDLTTEKTFDPKNFNSLDQIGGMLVGLSLVKKLVDNEFVNPEQNGTGFHIIDKTKEITAKLLDYIARENADKWTRWKIMDVYGNFSALAKANGGELSWLSYPFARIGAHILEDDKYYDIRMKRWWMYYTSYLWAPLVGTKPKSLKWLWHGILNQNWPGIVGYPFQLVLGLPGLDIDVKFQGGTGGFDPPLNYEVVLFESNEPAYSEYNASIVFQLAAIDGSYDHQQMALQCQNLNLQLYELIYAILNDEPSLILQHNLHDVAQDLANAPCGNKFSQPNAGAYDFSQWGVEGHGWRNTFRWNKPFESYAGDGADDNKGLHSSVDWMIYYLAYHLLNKNNLPPFKEDYNNCECVREIVPATQTDVTTSLDVFSKFDYYSDLGIANNHFLAHTLNVNNNAFLVTQDHFILCNSGSLNIQSSGAGGNAYASIGSSTITHPVSGTVGYQSNMEVRNGSSVTIHDGGELRIENNSRADFLEGSSLHIKDGGKLIINDLNELKIHDGAHLIFDEGAEIQLLGDDAVLDIAGKLILGHNAIFKITHPGNSSGYIRWQGNGQPDQIAAGQDTEIHLLGTSDQNKVLDITDAYMIIPPEIKLFSTNNAKVEVSGANSSLAIQSDAFSMVGTNFHGSTTSHVRIYGQPGTLGGCDFDVTDLTGEMFGGQSLTVNNCHFTNDARITIFGAGLKFLNSTVDQSSAYGLEINSAFLPCDILNSSFSNCKKGLIVTGSSVTKIKNSQFTNNYTGASFADGLVNIRCSDFENNKFAVNTVTGGLQLSSFAGAGYNDFTNNEHALTFYLPWQLDISGGYNDFGSSRITGTLPYDPNQTFVDGNENNYAFSDPNVQPGPQWPQADIKMVDGTATPLGAFTIPLNLQTQLTANPNASYPVSCGTYDNNSGGWWGGSNSPFVRCDNCQQVSTGTYSGYDLNEAILVASSLGELRDDTNGDDFQAIIAFHEIFTSTGIDETDPAQRFLAQFAYEEAESALQNCFRTEKITKADNQVNFHTCVNHFIDIINSRRATVNQGNYHTQFLLDLDEAETYYLAGKHNLAISLLDQIDNCYLEDIHYQLIAHWKAVIQLELDRENGTIAFDEYVSTYRDRVMPLIDKDPVVTNVNIGANVPSNVTIGSGTSIGANSDIGQNVVIGQHVSIGDNVEIGQNVVIGDHVVIEDNVKLEKDILIGSYAVIETLAEIKKETELGPFVHIGKSTTVAKENKIADGAWLGDNVDLEKSSKIGSNVIIRSGSKIKKEAQLGDNSILGKNTEADKEVVLGKGVEIKNGLALGKQVEVSDYEYVGQSLNNNTTLGSGVVSPPSTPFQVTHDVEFAMMYARNQTTFTPGIDLSAERILVGEPVKFTAEKTTKNYDWMFANNTAAQGQQATVTFEKSGVYGYKLSLSNACGDEALFGAVTVYPKHKTELEVLAGNCPRTDSVYLERSTSMIQSAAPTNLIDSQIAWMQLDDDRCRVLYDYAFSCGGSKQCVYEMSNPVGSNENFKKMYDLGPQYCEVHSDFQEQRLTDLVWQDNIFEYQQRQEFQVEQNTVAIISITDLTCDSGSVVLRGNDSLGQWVVNGISYTGDRIDIMTLPEDTLTISYAVTNGQGCYDYTEEVFVTHHCGVLLSESNDEVAWGQSDQSNALNEQSGAELSRINEKRKVTVFPNPGNGIFTVVGAEGMTYSLYSLQGKLLKQGAVVSTSQDLNIEQFAKGTYFLKLSKGSELSTIRICRY